LPQNPQRQVHALLGNLLAYRTMAEKDATANIPNFYTLLNL
jgi:hypothetical protein